ncbi:unnamed protein product [Paramecium octaurelia]|uniref:Uncharacterized protein n=1 Tax=Paramecium octaurelia TaxID=43137 RepID=A0A8S1VL47_PAROT|nr:unnamed protein product [Paramecium octaurelia]
MKRYVPVQSADEDSIRQPQAVKQLDIYDKIEQWGEWLWVKAQAVMWISAATGIVYYSNFFKQLFHNQNINELFLTFALLFIGMSISLSLYVAFYLPFIKGVTEDIETYNPKAIQLGAFAGFMSFITLTIAIWPVFGWWSFPMLFAMLLGFINTGHFLPNHQLSGVLFGAIFIGAFFSHYYIDHDGYMH